MKYSNFAVIGLGGRGAGMVEIFLKVPGFRLVAVCDILEERVEGCMKKLTDNPDCTNEVHAYTDYKQMLKNERLDGVYIATTWITHVPIALDCMRNGIDVGMEVGGASSLEECRALVDTYHETGKFCMLMENCCYDRKEMSLFNAVKQGIFGEIVHMEAGYRHDLRDEIVLGRENHHGRLVNFIHRNGDLYPTHGVGPLCKVVGINKGNRFLSIVSVASKARGLHEWIGSNLGTDYDLYDCKFNCGDVVTSIIKCANGETIKLAHACSLPRPYNRDYTLEGTKAIFKEGFNYPNDQIYIDGVSPKDKWEDYNTTHLKEFEHPLWIKYNANEMKFGHGGMDYFICAAFVDSVLNGHKPPIDTYDTATWIAITVLSEQSVALGGQSLPFPDFTDGKWIDRADDYDRTEFCLDDVCMEFFSESEDK